MKEIALQICHLNKQFGKRQILHDVSFETYTGEVFGFLGPNGAGKTTTIKMIVGMLSIDEGDISICGVNVSKDFEGAMANIGAIVENPEMYKYMSGLDNLRQYARMRNGVTEERIHEVVEFVGLSNRIKEKVGKYSLGMRQRLGVAQALLHNPKVLILDEPTNGLDPQGIKTLRDILKKLAHEEGVCVIVSSHLMSEMELMCDRVAIITNGSLLGVHTVDEMIRQANGNEERYKLEVNDSDRASWIISSMDGFKQSSDHNIEIIDERHLIVSINHSKNSDNVDTSTRYKSLRISHINKALIKADIELCTVTLLETKKLEDAFIALTSTGGDQIA